MTDAADKLVTECPACRQRFRTDAANRGKTCRCRCGETFVIGEVSAAAAPLAGPALGGYGSSVPAGPNACPRHPHLPVTLACSRCGTRMCSQCARQLGDGRYICPACAHASGGAAAPDGSAWAAPAWTGPAGPPTPPRFSSPGDPPVAAVLPPSPWAAGAVPAPPAVTANFGLCINHRGESAVARCSACGASICPTCLFAFDAGLLMCPHCATSPPTRLSPARKTRAWWAIALAVWCSAGMALIFSGALAGLIDSVDDVEALGVLLILFVGAPSLGGALLGISTVERRLPNPPLTWVAAIWTGLLAVGYLLLMVSGMMAD